VGEGANTYTALIAIVLIVPHHSWGAVAVLSAGSEICYFRPRRCYLEAEDYIIASHHRHLAEHQKIDGEPGTNQEVTRTV